MASKAKLAIPKLSKNEWIFIAILFVAGLWALRGIFAGRDTSGAIGDLESRARKDFLDAMGAVILLITANKLIPALLARAGVTIGAAVIGGPALAVAAGATFWAMGGYELVASYFDFLPSIRRPDSWRNPDATTPTCGTKLCIGTPQ